MIISLFKLTTFFGFTFQQFDPVYTIGIIGVHSGHIRPVKILKQFNHRLSLR